MLSGQYGIAENDGSHFLWLHNRRQSYQSFPPINRIFQCHSNIVIMNGGMSVNIGIVIAAAEGTSSISMFGSLEQIDCFQIELRYSINVTSYKCCLSSVRIINYLIINSSKYAPSPCQSLCFTKRYRTPKSASTIL